MKRTQLYLDDTLFRLLVQIGREKKKTISELVRKALEKVYLRGRKKPDALRALEATFGIWKNRKDLPSTEEYIRELRRDSRLKRFGLA